MSDDRIVRVHYFPQQFLRTEDFTKEQAYHLAMRRRHNIAHHVWGIVHGLELRVEEDGLFVLPGLAIDGYGRELVLTERKRISRISGDEFTQRNSDELAVWLQYGRSGSDEVPEGYYKVCNVTARKDYYRWEEIPELVLEPPDSGNLSPREPNKVAPQDIPFTAERTPPDDPAQPWPVYLGKLIRDRSNLEETYKVEPVGRPAAGLVGEGIRAPSGRAQLGLEGKVAPASDASDVTKAKVRSSRFRISLYHPQKCDKPGMEKVKARKNGDGKSEQQCDKRRAWIDHLSINSAGEIDLCGRASIHGDLRMVGGAIEFKAPTEAEGPPDCDAEQATDVAHPWRMYRYRCSRAVESSRAVDNDGQEGGTLKEVIDELRVELAPISDAKQQLVIGAWSPEDEAFKPFLTVGNVYHPAGDYSVTVHGNLIVKGSIKKEEAPSARRLSSEARNYLLGTYSGGVSGANLQLNKHYKSPFNPTACDLESDAGQDAVVQALLQPGTDPRSRMVRFVEKMLLTLEARQELETQLSLNATWIGELMGMALAIDLPRETVIDAVAGDDTARDEMETELAGNTTWVGEFMGKALATDPPRETVIDAVSGDVTARDEIETELAGNSTWVGEFMGKALATDPPRETVINAVAGDTTARDDMEAQLVGNSTWVGEFMDKALATDPPRETVINAVAGNTTARDEIEAELVGNSTWVGELMDKALATDPPRETVIVAVSGDATARDEVETALVGNTTWVGELMDKALATDPPRETVIVAVSGDATARDEVETELVGNTTWVGELMDKALAIDPPRETVIDAVAGDDTARDEIEAELAGNTTWVGELMVKALATDPPRETVIDAVAGDDTARDEMETELAGNTTWVGEFIDKALVADPPRGTVIGAVTGNATARDEMETELAGNTTWVGEFMGKALATDPPRATVIDAVTGDDTTRDEIEDTLVADPALLREVTTKAAASDADVVTQVLLEGASGPSAVGSYLASHVSTLTPVLEPVLADEAARDRVAVDLIAYSDGPASVMDALEPDQTPDILATFTGLLQQSDYANRLPRFAADTAATDAGRRAIIEYGLPEAAPATALNAFGQLAQTDYPSWLNTFLRIVQQTSGGSQTVAENLVGSADGRTAVMDALAPGQDPDVLGAFAELLTVEQIGTLVYEDRLPAFAQALVATQPGAESIMDTLTVDDDGTSSEALARFTGLLNQVEEGGSELEYADRLPAFAGALLEHPAGADAVTALLMETDGGDLVYAERLPGFAAALTETHEGAESIMDTLTVDDDGTSSEALARFTGLLNQVEEGGSELEYDDRLPAFADAILKTSTGAETLVADMADNSAHSGIFWTALDASTAVKTSLCGDTAPGP